MTKITLFLIFRSARIKFFLNYWQGNVPLNISLWLVFLGVLISFSLIETTLLEKLFTDPDKRIQATYTSLILSRGFLFIWLLVGLFRASEKDFLEQDTQKFPKAVPYYDLSAEQERDMSIFRSRYISRSFLSKMFDQHAGSMWFPDPKELLEAGVIHEVLQE